MSETRLLITRGPAYDGSDADAFPEDEQDIQFAQNWRKCFDEAVLVMFRKQYIPRALGNFVLAYSFEPNGIIEIRNNTGYSCFVLITRASAILDLDLCQQSRLLFFDNKSGSIVLNVKNIPAAQLGLACDYLNTCPRNHTEPNFELDAIKSLDQIPDITPKEREWLHRVVASGHIVRFATTLVTHSLAPRWRRAFALVELEAVIEYCIKSPNATEIEWFWRVSVWRRTLMCATLAVCAFNLVLGLMVTFISPPAPKYLWWCSGATTVIVVLMLLVGWLNSHTWALMYLFCLTAFSLLPAVSIAPSPWSGWVAVVLLAHCLLVTITGAWFVFIFFTFCRASFPRTPNRFRYKSRIVDSDRGWD